MVTAWASLLVAAVNMCAVLPLVGAVPQMTAPAVDTGGYTSVQYIGCVSTASSDNPMMSPGLSAPPPVLIREGLWRNIGP